MALEFHEAVHPSLLTDDELYAEAVALQAACDRDALADPLSLARNLDPLMVSRRHLRVASRAIAEIEPGSGARLMIVMPPQVGKSKLAGVWTPFWWLCQNPTHRGIIGSYAASLAVDRGREVRSLVHRFGHRFGLTLDRSSKAKNNWLLSTGGGIKSAGVGGGITGTPANIGIIDDPIKGRAEADSPTIREKIWNWYSGDFYSRLSPGAPVIIMMTRWHEDDLIGRLLAEQGTIEQGGRWRLIFLPSLAVDPDPKLHIPPDSMGRAKGEPLTHPLIGPKDEERLRAHWEDKRTSSTTRDYNALYQGCPRPVEGALLSRQLLRQRRDFFPAAKPVKYAIAVDPSGGGRSSCGIVGGWLGDDKRLYFCADRTDVMSSERWGDAVCMLAAELEAYQVWVERNYGGDMYRVINTAWDQLRRRAYAYRDKHPAGADGVDAGLAALGATREHGGSLAMAPDLPRHVVEAALTLASEPTDDETSAIYGNSDDAAKLRATARKHLARTLADHGVTTPAPVMAGVIAAARYTRLAPTVAPSNARLNKRLRAEPVAHQFSADRVRTSAPLPELEDEWATWTDEYDYSPGRIDASVHLALRLLPIPGTGAQGASPAGVTRSQAQGSGAAGMPRIPRTTGDLPFGGFKDKF